MAGIVDAIPQETCNEIHRLLKKWHKTTLYADLWKFGLNVPVRISDLLGLKMNSRFLARNKDGILTNYIRLVEKKTQKQQLIPLNDTANDIWNRREQKFDDHTYLFESDSIRSRRGTPISRFTVYKAFSEAGDYLGYNVGCHTTRKSRGKHLFDAGVPIEVICRMLNHHNPSVTMRYLGIDQNRVHQTYDFNL